MRSGRPQLVCGVSLYEDILSADLRAYLDNLREDLIGRLYVRRSDSEAVTGGEVGSAVDYGSATSILTRKHTRADIGHTLAISVPDKGPLPVSAIVGLCVK